MVPDVPMQPHLVQLPGIGAQAQTTQRTLQPRKEPAKPSGPRYENLLFIGAAIVGFILLLLAIRWAMRISKWVFLACAFLFGGIWMSYTLYHRTEPKWLTPLFDVLAEWLPTKDYKPLDPIEGPKKK